MSTIKFCRECNNILYPKEDKEIHQLLYACNNCEYQEASDNNIVYKMEIRKLSTEGGTGVLKDAVADASLPRTRSVKCANCNHSEAVFFQEPQIYRFIGRNDLKFIHHIVKSDPAVVVYIWSILFGIGALCNVNANEMEEVPWWNKYRNRLQSSEKCTKKATWKFQKVSISTVRGCGTL